MKGLGIIVNVLAVIIAGMVGLTFRGKMKAIYQELMLRAVGAVILVVGMTEFILGLFVIKDKQIEVTGSLLVLFSLVVGTMLGDALNLEEMLDTVGRALKRLTVRQTGKKKESPSETRTPSPKKKRRIEDLPIYNLPSERSGHRFVDGFVIASLFVCMNAMLLRGTLADITGTPTVMYIKSVVDFVVVLVLTMVYGSGVCFCALPLLIGEVSIAVIASVAGTFFTDKLVDQLCVIGSVMVLAVGINLAFRKRLKAANLMPAWCIPVAYYWINDLVLKLMNHS